MRFLFLALCVVVLGASCREYRPADPLHPRVEPVRVQFATPRTVVLHRQSDSLLVGVSRLEGTLVWSDRDSLRIGVTGAQTSNGWRSVQAPSDAVVPLQSGVVIQHRVLSKTKTVLMIAGAWAAIVAVIAASLK
jgi:hypothetical protein